MVDLINDEGMSLTEFQTLSTVMYAWLEERNIIYSPIFAASWHNLPISIYIYNEEDAVMFKLTFGL